MTSPVKLIRQKLCLTQTALANELGVTRQMIYRYENDKSNLSFSIIKKLIAVAHKQGLSISSSDFFIDEQ